MLGSSVKIVRFIIAPAKPSNLFLRVPSSTVRPPSLSPLKIMSPLRGLLTRPFIKSAARAYWTTIDRIVLNFWFIPQFDYFKSIFNSYFSFGEGYPPHCLVREFANGLFPQLFPLGYTEFVHRYSNKEEKCDKITFPEKRTTSASSLAPPTKYTGKFVLVQRVLWMG